LKFNETLKVKLRQDREDGTIYKEPYFSSSTMTLLNEDETPEGLDLSREESYE